MSLIEALVANMNKKKPAKGQSHGAICVNHLGEILLVRGHLSNKWSFPKGHADSKEEDSLVCAKRELFEETGILVTEKHISCHKFYGGIYYIFALNDKVVIDIQDKNEIAEAIWWPIDSLPKETNVDVSIFKTLTKNLWFKESKEILCYLNSYHSHVRCQQINQAIRTSTIKKEEKIAN
jgi:8-oxo-dGTP pyrophosphatase MutT (NUDIX family)